MKTLFWVKGVDELLQGSDKVAGIQVQIAFWAKTFVMRGHKVVCLTDNDNSIIDGIRFEHSMIPNVLVRLHLSLLGELIEDLRILIKLNPDFVFVRGAGRYMFILSIICKVLGIKIVFFGASDVNFVPGKDIVNGNEKYTKLYRRSIKRIDYFITQNTFQSETLKDNYHRESLTLPNIWMKAGNATGSQKRYDFIWVANFRKLKRAEWFIRTAVNYPEYRFAIVGGVSDGAYYDEMRKLAKDVPNLEFMGPQPFNIVNKLISFSCVLCCTSEYEGFPNTFIQAWAYNVPVISTVDPSDIVKTHNLGIICRDEASFCKNVGLMLKDKKSYDSYADNIKEYFYLNHDADTAYKKLVQWIKLR